MITLLREKSPQRCSGALIKWCYFTTSVQSLNLNLSWPSGWMITVSIAAIHKRSSNSSSTSFWLLRFLIKLSSRRLLLCRSRFKPSSSVTRLRTYVAPSLWELQLKCNACNDTKRAKLKDYSMQKHYESQARSYGPIKHRSFIFTKIRRQVH